MTELQISLYKSMVRNKIQHRKLVRKATWGKRKGRCSLVPHTKGSLLLYDMSCSHGNTASLLYSFLSSLDPKH